MGEKPLVSLGAGGKFNVLECDSRAITRVCRSSMAAETRGLALQLDSMQFYADLLGEILGQSAPSSKNLHMRQSATKWPKTIVTDARDVYDRVSTEKGGFPQQKALTKEITTIGEWLVTSGAEIRWTADEKMIKHGLTKDHRKSRKHLARIMQEGEWSIQHVTAFIRGESGSGPKRARKTGPSRASPMKT